MSPIYSDKQERDQIIKDHLLNVSGSPQAATKIFESYDDVTKDHVYRSVYKASVKGNVDEDRKKKIMGKALQFRGGYFAFNDSVGIYPDVSAVVLDRPATEGEWQIVEVEGALVTIEFKGSMKLTLDADNSIEVYNDPLVESQIIQPEQLKQPEVLHSEEAGQ